jgi:hypothetical protein
VVLASSPTRLIPSSALGQILSQLGTRRLEARPKCWLCLDEFVGSCRIKVNGHLPAFSDDEIKEPDKMLNAVVIIIHNLYTFIYNSSSKKQG